MNKDIQEYEKQIKAGEARNMDLHRQLQLQQDVNFEQENLHIFEEKQMRAKHNEIVNELEFELNVHIDEKGYLEQQRANVAEENRNLFNINSELEKEVADLKIEVSNLQEQLAVNNEREAKEIEKMTNMTQKLVNDLSVIKQKMASMEKSQSAQLQEMHTKMAN